MNKSKKRKLHPPHSPYIFFFLWGNVSAAFYGMFFSCHILYRERAEMYEGMRFFISMCEGVQSSENVLMCLKGKKIYFALAFIFSRGIYLLSQYLLSMEVFLLSPRKK